MKKSVCFIMFSFLLFIYYPAKADIVNEFVQVQCLEDLNALKIDVFGANGEIASKRSRENQKELWERHGIREVYTMVDYIRLEDENGKPSEDYRDTRMIVKDPIQTSCTLIEELGDGKREPRTYDIYIEPYFFNTNPNGHCGGGPPTIELTITSGDQVLIDHLRFMSECSSSYWYQHDKNTAMGGLYAVDINPEDRYISLYGGLDEEYEDDFVFTSTFWFNEDLPITHEGVYGNRKVHK